MTENDILDIVYALYEGDDEGWDTTSDEYLAGRKYANAAINIWEHFDNTEWRELWAKLEDADDGDSETVADTYSYDCPTNFVRPGSWVRINGEFYTVIGPEKRGSLADSDDRWCYFTGSPKDGYTLNFNPRLSIIAGQTIEYEYYKSATTFTATDSTTEMSDPYMIVYYVLYRLLKNDGEDYMEERDMYESKLDDMQTVNWSGFAGITNPLDDGLDIEGGFGQ